MENSYLIDTYLGHQVSLTMAAASVPEETVHGQFTLNCCMQMTSMGARAPFMQRV